MSVKGASSSSSSGSGQSKKNWKTKRKKWEDKPNLGGKKNWKNENWRNDQSNKNDQNKGTYKHCNKLHYGECWFKDKVKVSQMQQNQASKKTNMFYASHSLSKPTDFGVWCLEFEVQGEDENRGISSSFWKGDTCD
ncbi:unnamed protein product [Prunus armeniaca]